jgi:hypothetical protein
MRNPVLRTLALICALSLTLAALPALAARPAQVIFFVA